jgi:hypothetical protein
MFQQLVFAAFHSEPVGFAAVIVALKMKDSVQDVANQFLLPGRAKSCCLDARFVNAHKDLTLEGGSVGTLSVVERDHIRNAAMSQKRLV